VNQPAYINRAMRRSGHPDKPGYQTRIGGCPHTLGKFFTVSERSSRLSRATYPCVEPPGHDRPRDDRPATAHRTAGGKQWT
jgi:hypothetical protein